MSTDITTIPARILSAIEIAMGRSPMAEAPIVIMGAKKNVNSKGRGDHWFRMVWIPVSQKWEYVSPDRLPAGSFSARDRKAEVWGEVNPGHLIISHSRGGPVQSVYIVCSDETGNDDVLIRCEFNRTRDKKLRITLPNGEQIILPDPRD